MRSTLRITVPVVTKLRNGDVVRDTDIRGFGARCRAECVSYFVQTRVKGRLRWFTIGKHGSPWTVETARSEAKDILYKASKGVASDEAKRKEREQKETFAALFDRFLASHGKRIKPNTRINYEGLGRLYLKPTFGTKRVQDITAEDVVEAHEVWSDKPRAANHAVAVLSKFMNWADERGLRDGKRNPCDKVERYEEARRDRYLRDEEVIRLGATLKQVLKDGSCSEFAVAAILLLMFTGARRGEILTLKWSYVDLKRMIAVLPDSKTGSKVLMLNEEAVAVLERLPRIEGNPYVIAGTVQGGHLVDLKSQWHRIRKLAGLDDLRIHDLRHSFASFAADSGGTLEVVGNVLGHSRPETTAGYVHLFDKRPKELSSVTAERISRLLGQRS